MVSIIIPVGPNDKHIDYCLTALYKSSNSPLNVIIVLDGWKRKFSASPKYWELRIFSIDKCGPAACRNYGAKQAKTELLCFIDSDVELHENIINDSVNFISNQKINGVIGSYDNTPLDKSIVSEFRNLLHHYHHNKNNGQKGVFWGAFSVIDRNAFTKAGGFNENYSKPSIEDIELGYRLLENEYIILINSTLQIKHRKTWSFKNMVYTDIFLRAKPWTILLNKHKKWNSSGLNTSSKEKVSAFLVLATYFLLLLSIQNIWLILPAITCLLGLICIQLSLYSFFVKRVSLYKIPIIFALHHVYYLSALTGFAFGQLDKYTNKKEYTFE